MKEEVYINSKDFSQIGYGERGLRGCFFFYFPEKNCKVISYLKAKIIETKTK